jgi:hypothetical protein
MKVSQLRKLIKEEVSTVLKEVEQNDALEAIDSIKASVKRLSATKVVEEDAVLQKLMAKYTGLLGKITSYVKQKYTAPEPAVEPNTEEVPETEPSDETV